jgi:hypothetical protein
MKLVIALGLAAMTSCGVTPQRLVSPCAAEPKPTDASQCPSCASDAECSVLSNPCLSTASCIPTKGNWAVIAIGCESAAQYAPTTTPCRCIDGVCRSP